MLFPTEVPAQHTAQGDPSNDMISRGQARSAARRVATAVQPRVAHYLVYHKGTAHSKPASYPHPCGAVPSSTLGETVPGMDPDHSITAQNLVAHIVAELSAHVNSDPADGKVEGVSEISSGRANVV